MTPRSSGIYKMTERQLSGCDSDSEAGTCPFESDEHVPFTFTLAYECSSRIDISTLRSVDSYKAGTGCVCDSGRENIVGYDQGTPVSTFSFFLNTDLGIGKWTRILRNVYATLPLSPNRGLLYETRKRSDRCPRRLHHQSRD